MKSSVKAGNDASTIYVIVLGLLTTLGPFTIDLYIPAFPQIRNAFNASDGLVQLTLAATTIGFAIGQLVVGTWSDRIGRRLPLLVATSLHVLASVGCAIAPSIYVLCVLRVLQGIGAAASAVVVRAAVRDQFEGSTLAVMLSRVGFVTTVTPILAPVLGAELLQITGWRGIFVVLAGFGIILAILATFLVAETYPAERRLIQDQAVRQKLLVLFKDRVFLGSTFVGAMVYAAVYAYVAASPLLIQSIYGFSPRQFSVTFLVNTLGLALGIRLNIYLVKKWTMQAALLFALSMMSISALSIAAISVITPSPVGSLAALWLFITSTGLAFPNASALSLYNHKQRAGTAASIYGAFCFTVAGLLSPVIGFVGIASAAPIGVVLTIVSLAGLIGAWKISLLVKSAPLGYSDLPAKRD